MAAAYGVSVCVFSMFPERNHFAIFSYFTSLYCLYMFAGNPLFSLCLTSTSRFFHWNLKGSRKAQKERKR